MKKEYISTKLPSPELNEKGKLLVQANRDRRDVKRLLRKLIKDK